MKYLTTILKKMLPSMLPNKLPNPIGRWNIDYCDVKINRKIDFSNEDHCGPCGQYKIKNSDPIIADKEK